MIEGFSDSTTNERKEPGARSQEAERRSMKYELPSPEPRVPTSYFLLPLFSRELMAES
jgi:hypothetical protein